MMGGLSLIRLYQNVKKIFSQLYELYQFAKQEGEKFGITVTPFDRMSIIKDKLGKKEQIIS